MCKAEPPSSALAGAAQHRDGYGGSYTLRGNATRIDSLGCPSVCRKFDTLVNLVSQVNSAGQTLDLSWSTGSGYSLVRLIRPNRNTALERTMQDNALLDMTRVTSPNTVEQDFAHDTPHGPTSGEMEMGAAVDREYAACGRSPMEKLKRVSRPYAPAGTLYSTTYTWGALGRATQTTGPAGQSTTDESVGNTVKVTEPNQDGGTWDTPYPFASPIMHRARACGRWCDPPGSPRSAGTAARLWREKLTAWQGANRMAGWHEFRWTKAECPDNPTPSPLTLRWKFEILLPDVPTP